jgi:sulfane dehydrogenase subunit SoxC
VEIKFVNFKEEPMDTNQPKAPKLSSRRELLKGGALMAVGAVATGAASKLVTPALADTTTSYVIDSAPQVPDTVDTIAYGERSHYVTAVRVQESGRAPPPGFDDFGFTYHVQTPLQDSYGSMQASSLHYFATTKAAFVPDIDPDEHTLMIQGEVERPLILTMADLKRFPSVSRFHFVECAGNSHNASHKTVQDSHGLTSNAEWTGVLLSTLLNEAGVKDSGKWFIAEGAEWNKGADSISMAKGMDDCIVAYAMNGEPLRPQNGFPLRLVTPGYEGIYNTKWLRRINVVDKYQLNMDDFGHLYRDETTAALGMSWGPKSIITFPSGEQKLTDHGWYEITGLAWSGQGVVTKVEVSTDGGETWNEAELKTTPNPMAHTRFGYMWNWQGGEHVIMSRTTDEKGSIQPTLQQVAEYFKVEYTPKYRPPGRNNTIMPWKIASDGSVTNGLA